MANFGYHRKYIEKVLERFNMSKDKLVSTPLANHFKLNSKQCPENDKEKDEMNSTLCIGSWQFDVCYGVY